MIDSGSQSTACSVDFSKGNATDDTERAKLWDIQDQKLKEQSKKMSSFMAKPTRLLSRPASKWMCRMLREVLLL